MSSQRERKTAGIKEFSMIYIKKLLKFHFVSVIISVFGVYLSIDTPRDHTIYHSTAKIWVYKFAKFFSCFNTKLLKL